MTATDSSPAVRKKLLIRIAAAQKQADGAKKLAKLAKAGFKAAKQKLKEAKRAAKKQRKELKALKAELAALATTRKPVRKGPQKPPVKRSRVSAIPVSEPAPEQTAVSQPPETSAEGGAPAQ